MRIKLILDPCAGRRKGRRFLPKIKEILGRGNLLDVSVTKGPGEALLLAREVAQNNHEIIVVGGGDGTLNEVINGVLRVRSDLPLGFIPLGMTNLAAWTLGLPQDPVKACKIILNKKIKRIDLGKLTKPFLRYFISEVTLGFPASISKRAESNFKLKMLLGKFAYFLGGYFELFRYGFLSLGVRINGNLSEGTTIIISNGGYFMGNSKIFPQAKIDDGYLDVCIFKKRGKLNMHRYFLGALLNRLHAFSDVEFFRAKKISITSSENIPGSMDGDPLGSIPAEIEIAPQILPMIVP